MKAYCKKKAVKYMQPTNEQTRIKQINMLIH